MPIVHLSAKTGRGVKELLDLAARASKEFKRRIPTGELNRFFEGVLQSTRRPPARAAPRASSTSRRPKLTRRASSHVQRAGYITEAYKRFVANQIRKAFDFRAVPITVEYRARKRNENGAGRGQGALTQIVTERRATGSSGHARQRPGPAP